MQAMHELKEMLCDELKEIVKKGELSSSSLDTVDKITHSIKSLVTIMAMEDSGYSNDGGYSQARRRDSMGRYADSGSYNRGSYGRYSDGEESQDGYSGRRYSRDEGKTNLVHKLERMMDNAPTQEDREVIQTALSKLRNM